MTILIYLTKTVLISAVLLGYYWLFLRNRIFHGFNRYILLSIPVISTLLPAFHFYLPALWNQAGPASPIRLWGVGQGRLEEAVIVYASHHAGTHSPWEFMLAGLSALLSLILAFRLFRSVHFLWRLRKESPSLELADATVFFVDEKEAPFSFFKSIFWGREMDMNSSAGKQILRHELFHVRNNHSLDILLTEIFIVLFWFNPFLHILRRELQAIHEYAADADAAKETGGFEYASLLLMKISGSPLYLTNPFFKSQIKRRITMIANTGKNKTNTLGRMMILPLILALACLFSFKLHSHSSIFPPARIRVVIDAGHGGVFPGKVADAGSKEVNIHMNRDTNIVFTKVDVEADYPGGPQAWFSYLQKNLKYPQRAVMNEIQGEVMMEFIVKKNGKLRNVHAISGPTELIEASVNIIKGSGKWVPAKQHGEVVESYHRQPIVFKLQEG
jgi:Gram-negative bacterial TonB protein C-terminal/BlaR1 peptidase M56